EYGDNVRRKLELAQSVDADEVAAAYRAVESWRQHEPEVDLFVAPVLGIDLPPEDCDELDVRIPFTAFAPPVNPLGSAGLRIGDRARSSATSLSTVAFSSAGATTSVRSPIASASAAPTRRPRMTRSFARPRPIIRASRCVPPLPGIIPIFTSGSASSTSSAAM